MRPRFGLFRLLGLAVLLGIVGVIAYNLGWSNGVATHLPAGASAPPYYYYGGPFGGGFAFFGFLWFLLILFGVFWLFRLAFFGRRYWGGGWGPGRGPGDHPMTREERMREWHQRAHGEAPSNPSGTTPQPSAPPSG
jgi:hypothetical protein